MRVSTHCDLNIRRAWSMNLKYDSRVTLDLEPIGLANDVIVLDEPSVRVKAFASLDSTNPISFIVEKDVDETAILNQILHGLFSILIVF